MSLTLAAILILSAWVIAILVAGLFMALRPGGEGVRLTGTTGGAPPSASGQAVGERDEILLGGEAEALGNIRGRVQAVHMRPGDRRLEALELAGGLIESEPLPADAIVSADGRVLHLAESTRDMPLTPPPNTAVLRRNLRAMSADRKTLGNLRLVCFDRATRIVTALVLARRGTSGMLLLPINRVLEIGPDRILTDVRTGDSQRLDAFATDWEIRDALNQRLAADPTLEPLQRSLRVDVHDQRVRVRGYATDRAQYERIERLVKEIPGVLELNLQLQTDDGLARAVQGALARDPATAQAQLHVSVRNGAVDITGEAPDRSAMRQIERVARQVEGVQVLHNMVAVRPARATA